jgi:hypothetical protein
MARVNTPARVRHQAEPVDFRVSTQDIIIFRRGEKSSEKVSAR